jgi:hypothetical protein
MLYGCGEDGMSITVSNDAASYLARATALRLRAESAVFPDIKAHLMGMAESWETLAHAAAQIANPFAAAHIAQFDQEPQT